MRAVDPSAEGTAGNVCDSGGAQIAHGVRFWDHAGHRHHAVVYVSSGGHAGYDYPGNTKITGVGCVETIIVRDTHNGDGPKFLPWRGVYAPDWTGNNAIVPF